jgi:adenine-specific DNA methylase
MKAKTIVRGRLWVTSYDFRDENADKKLFMKDYNMLVRWIKKNVPYQDVPCETYTGIHLYKSYADDNIVKLAYQGMKLM